MTNPTPATRLQSRGHPQPSCNRDLRIRTFRRRCSRGDGQQGRGLAQWVAPGVESGKRGRPGPVHLIIGSHAVKFLGAFSWFP